MQRLTIAFTALILFVAGCSDNADDPKYRSLPPEISDLTLAPLDGSTELRANTPIVATVQQSKLGTLINKTTYSWKTSPIDIDHKYVKGVIYEQEPQNPTDTITFANKGTYTLTFTGRYHTSGGYEQRNYSVEIPDGKVTYSTPSLMYYDVKVEKTVRIK